MLSFKFTALLFVVISCVHGFTLKGDPELLCGECRDTLDKLTMETANGTATEGITHALEKLCSKSKNPTKCLAGVNELIKGLNSTDDSIFLKYPPMALCSAADLCVLDCCVTPFLPEQIHLSVGANYSEMVVTWVTLEHTGLPTVQYGLAPNSLTQQAQAVFNTYTQGGWRGAIYTAVMTGLLPSTRYYYQVGDTSVPHMWSNPSTSQPPQLNFVTENPSPAAAFSFAVVGDAGATDVSDLTYYQLTRLRHSDLINMTVHIGDVSYADGYETIWDSFVRKIEPVAAYAPYMSVQGNHEGFFEFHPYLARFHMPHSASGAPDAMQYSFNYGPVHFVAFNTEGFMGLEPVHIKKGSAVYNWLAADLSAVDRRVTPWVVAYGHRPLYCVEHNADCEAKAKVLREDYEDLFHSNGVDVVLGGHRHNYQTMYPVYNDSALCTGSDSCFVAPKSPVYILDGAAGNKEHLNGFSSDLPPWSRLNLREYGYGVIDVHNSTHLTWSFQSAYDGSTLDTFTIVKQH